MAVHPLPTSYQTEAPTPITDSHGARVYPLLEAAIGHTFGASVVLLKQATSLEIIPNHDARADAHVAAIRALGRRLRHCKTFGEIVEIANEIERHCDGYDAADGLEDAEVHTVVACNVEARTEVRSASGQIDKAMRRKPGFKGQRAGKGQVTR